MDLVKVLFPHLFLLSWLQCWAFSCARTSNLKCPPSLLVGNSQKDFSLIVNLLPGVYVVCFKTSVFLLCLLFFVYLIFSEFERSVTEKLPFASSLTWPKEQRP